MKKKITIGVFLDVGILLARCSKNDAEENNAFDVLNYTQEFVTNLIIPANTKFISDVKDLNEGSANFIENTNEENLSILKNLWISAAISFSKTEVGNLGDIQTSAIYFSLYSWGANEIKIENFIASTDTMEESDINGLPTKARGLSAIEYLLFDTDLTTTVSSFSNQRRIDFLTALNANLFIKSSSLKERWENYSTAFINNTATDINGSINLIINQVNFLLENIIRFKVGEPAGLENSTVINPKLLQADKSEISLEIIKENIAAVKTLYYGSSEGLDIYVSTITNNENINDAIAIAFSAIESSIASISNTTLKKSIENDNYVVNELYNHLKDLIILIKVDVASALSVTVTFTDNDGD
jgi:predicted lipoprotein